MARTLCITILTSCIFGVLLGLGTAYTVLSVNGWEPELEMKTYGTLTELVLARTTNPNASAFIEETTHFFGVMGVQATGYHYFFIRNVGTEDLTLRLDRMTCGCTGMHISHERVPPGDTSTLRLEFSADQAMTGRFSESAAILTNDPNHREIQLIVEGVFTNPVVPIPASVDFQRVPAGTTRTATVRFFGFENEPLQLSAPTWTDRDHFDFHWEPSEFTEAELADEFHLALARSVVEGTITLKPGLPVGPFQEWFQVRTNLPSQPNVSFLARGQIVSGNVAISGQGFNRVTGVADLGRIATGTSVSRDFSIQFSGPAAPSASLQVSAVEPAWLQTSLSPPRDVGPLRILSLTIIIPENAPAGSYLFAGDGRHAHLTLETNDETMPILRIPLQFVVGR
jgi:hypothetical protein